MPKKIDEKETLITNPIRRRRFLAAAGAAGLGAALPKFSFAHSGDALVASELPTSVEGWPEHPLLQAEWKYSMDARSMAKPVHRSMIVDDMETDRGWVLSGVGSLDYSDEYVRTGSRSLVFSVPSRDEEYIAETRVQNGSFYADAGSGSTSAELTFTKPQDWSKYNRLAAWIYVDGRERWPHWFVIRFDGADQPTGAPYDPASFHFVELQAGQWNYVVWEIPEFPRNRVGRLKIGQVLLGRWGQDAPLSHYHIDRIELQQVDAEQYEGWQVAPGKIAFSHVGHLINERKLAIAEDKGVKQFELLDEIDNVAWRGDVEVTEGLKGKFALLDFTEFRTPGRYRLRLGDVKSHYFPIAEDLWLSVIEKSINSLYAMRCGPEVPGIHPRCHFDVLTRHEGELKVANGGWHDAGDTHQNANHTHAVLIGLIDLYNKLASNADEPRMRDRVLEEMCWGVDWSLRTRFSDGVRMTRNLSRFYSDNIVGNADDMIIDAAVATVGISAGVQKLPEFAALGAYTCAEAALALKDVDPVRAKQCRDAAIEDYEAVFDSMEWSPTGTSDIANAALCACAIHSLRGKKADAERAIAFGDQLLSCQERHFNGSPISGYFYDDLDRREVIQDNMTTKQESILRALSRLCEQFPEHPRWIEWYSAAVLHADYYLGRGAELSAPYFHLPNSIWTRESMDRYVESQFVRAKRIQDVRKQGEHPEWRARVASQYEEQYQAATPVSDKYRVRTFQYTPAPSMQQGRLYGPVKQGADLHIQLSMAAGLSSLAMLRNSVDNEELVKQQVQWVLGRNPFSQSLMYGAGYDFQTQWAFQHSGRMVGTLPVGMPSHRDDAPYWGAVSHMTFKEVWTIPQGKLLRILAGIGVPARVSGRAPAGASFIDSNGIERKVRPGRYSIRLQPGRYQVKYGDQSRTLTLVGGTDRVLRLDPKRTLHAEMTARVEDSGTVRLAAKLTGNGRFTLTPRLFNASVQGSEQNAPEQKISLDDSEQTLEWEFQIADAEAAWGTVLFADNIEEPLAELFQAPQSIPPMPTV